MNYNFKLRPDEYLGSCNSKDVISFGSKGAFTVRQIFNRVASAFDRQIVMAIGNSLSQKLEYKCNAKLLDEGENCEILRAGSSEWQAGKIRLRINLTLEFTADKPTQDTKQN